MPDAIHFHYLVERFRFTQRNELKQFLVKQFRREGKRLAAVNYVFCSDAYLLDINRQYLKHDTYTDIITFELSPKTQPLVADVYISLERVKENAIKYCTPFADELQRVIFHGALHLCGYKDKTEKDAATMRLMEERWLKAYRVSRETKRKEH